MRSRRAMTRLARLLAALGIVFSIAADAAAAGVVSRPDARGDVKAPGLTAIERNAIDIVGVDVVSDPDLGLLVTATFRGDFQSRVGHGGLAHAIATVIVNQSTSEPSLLSTDLGGQLGRTVREDRVHPLEVVREGNSITFMIMGATADDATGVQVRTFARRPQFVSSVLFATPADKSGTVPPAATPLTCPQAQVAVTWSTGALGSLRALRVTAQKYLDITNAAIANRSLPSSLGAGLRSLLRTLYGTAAGAPRIHTTKANALKALRFTAERLNGAVAALTSRITVLNDVVQAKLNVLVTGRCAPGGGGPAAPPAGNPPDAPTISPLVATLSDDKSETDYAITATSPAGRTLNYAWSLVPDADQPSCTNFDEGTPTPNAAVWQHDGTSEGCNPQAALGASGYGGTVTVVVSDGVYNCTATYHGTNSGTGPAPAPCTPRS